jgi:hypothetical protein
MRSVEQKQKEVVSFGVPRVPPELEESLAEL